MIKHTTLIIFTFLIFSGIHAQKVLLDGAEYEKLEYTLKEGDSLTMLNMHTSDIFISFEVTLVQELKSPTKKVADFEYNKLMSLIVDNNLFIEKNGHCYSVNHMKYYGISGEIFKASGDQVVIPEINLNASSRRREKVSDKDNRIEINFENKLYLDSVKTLYCFRVYYFTQVSAISSGIVEFSFIPEIGFNSINYTSENSMILLRKINETEASQFLKNQCK